MSKLTSKQSTAKTQEDFFCTDNLKKNLKGRSVRGGAATVGAQGIKFFLQTSTTLALARLLVPEDFGLIGMVTVVINFIQLFKDLGLSDATVQRQEISHRQVTTLFWINITASCVIALIVIVSAPLIAWFYSEPRLQAIICVLATTFIFGGLTVQHQALLKRQMQFGSIAKIEIGSVLISVIVAICFAKLGFGYWSLVYMQIAQTASNALGVWIFCRWRPGFPTDIERVDSLLAFGGNITGYSFANYFSRNLDNVLLGQYWGAQQLGFYAMAYKLLLLPVQQINAPVTSVALPALSRLQSEPANYKRYYHKALLLITSFGMPLVGFTFVAIDKVILVTLGEKWLDIIPIFKFLMPAAFVGTFNVIGGWVLISLDRSDRLFKLGMATSVVNVIIFLVSVRWGAVGLAAVYGFSRIFILFPTIIYIYKGTFLSIKELITTLFRPTLASIGSILILTGINSFTAISSNALLGLIVTLILYLFSYLTIWILIPQGRESAVEILSISKLIFRKKS